jgi:biopolymer transport protein ExbB
VHLGVFWTSIELRMSNVWHIIQAGGVVMIPLLLMSLIAGAIIVERLIAYKELGNTPDGLVDRVLNLCDGKRYDDAQRICEMKEGPVAASLAAVLQWRGMGTLNVERRVQEIGEGYFSRLEKFLPFLDTTTTIAPLLGLLGTLFGMIGTFQTIAASKSQASNDAVLAGVGEALYATATGLTVAVICFVAYNFFAARQRAVVSETEQAATKLINALIAQGAIAETGEQPQVYGRALGAV